MLVGVPAHDQKLLWKKINKKPAEMSHEDVIVDQNTIVENVRVETDEQNEE